MAIVVEVLVREGSQDVFNRVDARVGEAMGRMGGPPPGLMAHHVRPSSDGFVVCDVWRSEADWRPFHEQVMLVELAAEGLEPEPPTILPVWSFARP